MKYLPAMLGALQDRRIGSRFFFLASNEFPEDSPGPSRATGGHPVLRRLAASRPAVVEQFQSALRLKGVREPRPAGIPGKMCRLPPGERRGKRPGSRTLPRQNSGQETMLASILEPNAKVVSRYETHVAVMRNGENVIGVLKSRDGFQHGPGSAGMRVARFARR